MIKLQLKSSSALKLGLILIIIVVVINIFAFAFVLLPIYELAGENIPKEVALNRLNTLQLLAKILKISTYILLLGAFVSFALGIFLSRRNGR